MTAGQRAMAVAMIYPKPMTRQEAGALKGKSSSISEDLKPERLSEVRTTLQN